MKEKHIIKWVGGVKGIMAIVVFLRHYSNGFLPSLYTGNAMDAKALALERLINKTPLYFFVNGAFAVYVFWMLSAFLIGYHYFTNSALENMQRKALKKYFGMLLPIAITFILSFALIRNNLFYNIEASYITGSYWLSGFFSYEPSYPNLLWGIFVDTFFTSNVPYNPVLWTMKFEFLGSILSIMILCLFGNSKNRKAIYILWEIWIIVTFQFQYTCFVLGILLSDIYVHKKNELKAGLSTILITISLLGGSFPSDFWPTFHGSERLPSILTIGNINIETRAFIYCIASFLLIGAIMCSKEWKKFFECNILVYLGGVSLGIYMFHLIVECSISSLLFCFLISQIGSYTISLLIMLITSLAITIIIAKIFNYMISKTNSSLDKILSTLL